MHCSPPQPNSVVYGDAYGRQMSDRGEAEALKLPATNLPPILHRFRDIVVDRSEIAIFYYPSCV